MKKRAVSIVLIVFLLTALIPDGAAKRVYAASSDELNQSSVFLKQTESGTCTLFSVVMMIRRAAILLGDHDWASITATEVKKVAWSSDGLSADFSYKHNGITYRVRRGNLPRFDDENNANKQKLISLLKEHPEGIAIYRNYAPKHAVLLTDYTDGEFYCADPASGIAAGRIPASKAYSVTTENAKRYWYVTTSGSAGQTRSLQSVNDPDSFKASFSRTLSVKSSGYMNGDDVRYIQYCLKYLGYTIHTDGYYGPASAAVVKKFQSEHSVSPADGQCSRVTWTAIENAVNDKKQTGTDCSFTTSLKSPQVQNTAVGLTATGGEKYKFYSECGGTWTRIQDVSTSNSCTWKPVKAGTYHLYADVMDSSGRILICRKMTYVITEASLSVSVASPQEAGTVIRLTANGGDKYKFYSELDGAWERIQDVSDKNACDWKPVRAGTYQVYVDVMDAAGSLLICKKMTYVINGATFTASPSSPQELGATVRLTVKGGRKYKFYSECGGTWKLIRDVSEKNACDWKPDKAGTYHVYADVMDDSGNLVISRKLTYVIVKASITAGAASPQEVGTAIRLTASGGEKYKFYTECDGTRSVIQDVSTKNVCSWKPSKAGTYTLCADVMDSSGELLTCKEMTYSVIKTMLTASVASPQEPGTSVRLTASGGEKYKFYYECGGTWGVIRDSSTQNTCDWKPEKAGTYHLYADIMDGSGQLLICRKLTFDIVRATFTANLVSPQDTGTTIRLTASGGEKYQFYSERGGVKRTIQDVSTRNTCDWKPDTEGTYTLYANVMDGSGNLLSCREMNYVIRKAEFRASIAAQYVSPQNAGTTIRLSVNATGTQGSVKYRFYSECGGVWTRLRDYFTDSSYYWHATTVGDHTLYCDVKDGSGKVICVKLNYQIAKGTDFVADLKANAVSGETGSQMTLSAGTLNGSGEVSYKFYCERSGEWTTLWDYDANSTLKWTPEKAGDYHVYVDAKDAKGHSASKRLNISVAAGPVRIVSFTSDVASVFTGAPVTLKCDTIGGQGAVNYNFYSECGGVWKRIREFDTENSVIWKPAKAGAYNVYVDAMDSSGTVECRRLKINVMDELKATMTANADSPQNAGRTVLLSVNATGGTGSYRYQFYSECGSVLTKLWDYDKASTYEWHATTVGTHTLYCDVMDSSGKTVRASLTYQIVKGTAFVADLNANRLSGQYTGTQIKLTAGSYNGSGTVKYKFYLEKDGSWTKLSEYTTEKTIVWTPSVAGFYNVFVDAKDEKGKCASKRICFTVESGTPLKIKSFTANPSAPTKGSSVKLTGASTGGASPVQYKFYYKFNDTTVVLKNYSTAKTCTFTPKKAGTYYVYMNVTDGKKNTQTKKITLTVK